MRLWHVDLLEFLPKLQFDGQLRELVSIMRDVRDKGKTNHLLINRIMEYPRMHLFVYFLRYSEIYQERYNKPIPQKHYDEFCNFVDVVYFLPGGVFKDWHDKEYLRVCMANLYEKHVFGVGKSRITDEEWQKLLDGYKQITGEDYVI